MLQFKAKKAYLTVHVNISYSITNTQHLSENINTILQSFFASCFTYLCLISLHWLKIPEHVKFKLAVLTHRVLHGTAPVYLGPLCRVSDLPGRCSLRSASTDQLVIPPTRLSTVGTQSFAVTGPSVWNSLPLDITRIDSLPVFRRHLKNYLFPLSYPGIVVQ
jgi:hypothetical protein